LLNEISLVFIIVLYLFQILSFVVGYEEGDDTN